MVRPSDPFWIHAEELDDGQLRCQFCGYRFAAGISISRFKSHLAGVEGRGIEICTQVPRDVQEEAFQAIQEKPKSSNEVSSSVSTSRKPNDEVNKLWTVSNSDKVPRLGPVTSQERRIRLRELDMRYREIKKRKMNDLMVNQGQKMVRPSDPFWIHFKKLDDCQSQCQFREIKKRKMNDVEALKVETEQVRQWHFILKQKIEVLTKKMLEDECFLGQLKDFSSDLLGNFPHVTIEDVSQESDTVVQPLGRSRDRICSQLVGDDVLMNEVENIGREFVHPVVRGCSRDDPQHNVGETRRDDLPTTTELVGQAFEGNKTASPKTTEAVSQAFEENKKAIWSWLMDDDVPSIGIYGMGGVGKTRLAQHIFNQLHEQEDPTCKVYWITVSQDFSFYRLQNLIANRAGIDLSSEDNKLLRAVKLSKRLKNEQKWVLILDDLWDYFDPEEAGIPIHMKGCKLILTTRSLQVCRRVGCKKKIQVKPLCDGEAWTLFMEKLGPDVALSPEAEQIAKCIVRECGGLPLGIITMARSMWDVDDICEWRNALAELKVSKFRQDDMDMELFRVLRFSYTHLKDKSLQQCFLCCTLFPEGHLIEREKLLALLSAQGIVNGKDNYDKGHVMLNKLENVCLLEGSVDSNGLKYVKMHKLIRDMAIQIQQENSLVSVKANT